MKRQTLWKVFAAVGMGIAAVAVQAEFSAGVSPPRFEIDVKPGQVERRVIDLANPSAQPAKFKAYTNDWTLSEDGKLNFFDELQSGSCRPRVALERSSFTLPPGAKIRFRFEVQAPETATESSAECRFMIFFEGDDGIRSDSLISANGRVGVTVYARSGSTTASADVRGTQVVVASGEKLVALTVHNPGQITARLSGTLEGRDEAGKRWFLNVGGMPVLPGQTRSVPLTPVDPMDVNEHRPSNWVGELDLKGELRLSETTPATLKVAVKIKAP